MNYASPHRSATGSAGRFALAEGAVLVGAVVLLLYQWNIDPPGGAVRDGPGGPAPALVSALGVAIVGRAAWRAVAASEPAQWRRAGAPGQA